MIPLDSSPEVDGEQSAGLPDRATGQEGMQRPKQLKAAGGPPDANSAAGAGAGMKSERPR